VALHIGTNYYVVYLPSVSMERAEVSFILLKFSDIIRSRTKFTRTQQVYCLDWRDSVVRPATPGH